MKLIKFIFYFFLSRKFYLINTPFEYMAMAEYFYSKNCDISEFPLIVGYCSPNSKKQIKEIIKNFYKKNQKIFYLDELMNVKIFHLILFIQKNIKRKFLLIVAGSFNYYLFREFFKRSSKIVFIDDGYETINSVNEKEVKNWNCEFYSIYNIKNLDLKIEKNNFDLIKSFQVKQRVDKNLVFLLGSSIFQSKARIANYYLLLKDFIEANHKKKIIYFPHRGEIIDNNIKLFENFEIRKIEEPIETYLLKSNVSPCLIAGFYTAALYNFKKILINNDIEIMNINFDNSKQKWEESDRSFMHIYFMQHLKEVGVKDFYQSI